VERHLEDMTIQIQKLDEKLTKQQTQIDTEIPALTAQLEEKEQDLAVEVGRTEAFKYVNALKVDVLKGAIPDDVLDALKQESQLLRRDNKHLTAKAQKLARDHEALEVAAKASEAPKDAMSAEPSEIREQVQSLEDESHVLKIDPWSSHLAT